jgi:hypothetical protein
MQCPRCARKLTESDWLLCSVPGGHYCPHCWAEISEGGELLHPVGQHAGKDPQPQPEKSKDNTHD